MTLIKEMKTKEKLCSMTFNAHFDAQHGWVAVKKGIIYQLGLTDRITSFSYEQGRTVYLEEDHDLTQFVEAFKLVTGQSPKFKSMKHPPDDRESHIRRMARYTPQCITGQ